jgi:hypothetical protein
MWFAPKNRSLVLRTGQKMNRSELDAGGFCHQQIWEVLAKQYNQALQRATKQDEHTGAVSAPPTTLDFQ